MRKIRLEYKDGSRKFDLSGLKNMFDEVKGLGTNFKVERNRTLDLDFENIELNVYFGISGNAYKEYQLFTEFVLHNPFAYLVLVYSNNAQNERRADVVVENITKSQKTRYGVLEEKVRLKRLTPFYVLSSMKYLSTAEERVINDHLFDIPISFHIRTSSTEDLTFEVKTASGQSVSKLVISLPDAADYGGTSEDPIDLYIEPETHKVSIYQNEEFLSSGYELIDHTSDSFIWIPKGTFDMHIEVPTSPENNDYVIEEMKKWVSD